MGAESLQEGPRGGKYYTSKSGKKIYVGSDGLSAKGGKDSPDADRRELLRMKRAKSAESSLRNARDDARLDVSSRAEKEGREAKEEEFNEAVKKAEDAHSYKHGGAAERGDISPPVDDDLVADMEDRRDSLHDDVREISADMKESGKTAFEKLEALHAFSDASISYDDGTEDVIDVDFDSIDPQEFESDFQQAHSDINSVVGDDDWGWERGAVEPPEFDDPEERDSSFYQAADDAIAAFEDLQDVQQAALDRISSGKKDLKSALSRFDKSAPSEDADLSEFVKVEDPDAGSDAEADSPEGVEEADDDFDEAAYQEASGRYNSARELVEEIHSDAWTRRNEIQEDYDAVADFDTASLKSSIKQTKSILAAIKKMKG